MCFSLSVSFARSLGSLIDQAARERARAHNERARADCPRGGLIPRTPAREPGARFFEDVSFVHVWACVCVREARLERETARGMEIWMGDEERERKFFYFTTLFDAACPLDWIFRTAELRGVSYRLSVFSRYLHE